MKGKNKKKEPVTVEGLIEQGNKALNKLQPELASQFFKRAHEMQPEDTNIMDAYADVLMQTGNMCDAYELLEKSCSLAPLTNPFKWLFFAQLQQGQDAASTYNKAIEILTNELLSAHDSNNRDLLQKQICKAYCSVAELYMTDLCYDDNAESSCEKAIQNALSLDPSSLDSKQALASFRLSQSRPRDACVEIRAVFEKIKAIREKFASRALIEDITGGDDIDEDNPELEFCISTAKILIECGSTDPSLIECAIELIGSLLEEDDEIIEIWYIAGVACMSLQSPDYGSARYYLERAKEMMEKVQSHCIESNEEFPYSNEYELLQEHLKQIEEKETGESRRTQKDELMEVEMEEEWSTCDESEEIDDME